MVGTRIDHGRAAGRPARMLVLALLGAAGLTSCDYDTAPPFTIEGTGSVEGFLYFDADSDRRFDPSDGDEPVAGVGVAAVVRGTSQVLATATSGADGRFRIEGLPAGSHELLFDEASVPEGVFVCQNPVPATVFIDETAFTEVAARPACLITIAEAQQAAAGEFVLVRGVVTAFPGQFDEGDAAMQDETGGIWLFSGALEGQGIEVGDLIEVGGVVNLDVQALQLANVELRQIVKDVGVPDPIELTTAQIAAASDARDPLQNLLATVRGARLVTGFTSGGSRNATIDDGSGPTVVRVESVLSPDSGDGILAALGLEVGKCYDMTGIVGTFFGLAELFPRSPDDIVEVPCG